MAIELVPYADLKAYLGLSKSAITDYPDIVVIRDGVTAAIEAYIGRELEIVERTETVYCMGSPTKMIGLKGIPVSAVASVSVEYGDGTTATLGVMVNEYRVMQHGLMLAAEVYDAIVEITYTGGISTVPAGIARAALIQVAYEWQTKDHVGAETVSTEGGTVTRPALQLLKEVRRMLEPYKHPLMVA